MTITTPACLAQPGDVVIHDGRQVRVLQVHDHAPGGHADSPIRDEMVAREVVTETGIRWFGHQPGDAYRGAEVAIRYPDGVRFDPQI